LNVSDPQNTSSGLIQHYRGFPVAVPSQPPTVTALCLLLVPNCGDRHVCEWHAQCCHVKMEWLVVRT